MRICRKSIGTSRILAICMCSVYDGLMVMMFGLVPLRRLALPLHPVHLKTRTRAELVVKQMVIIFFLCALEVGLVCGKCLVFVRARQRREKRWVPGGGGGVWGYGITKELKM